MIGGLFDKNNEQKTIRSFLISSKQVEYAAIFHKPPSEGLGLHSLPTNTGFLNDNSGI